MTGNLRFRALRALRGVFGADLRSLGLFRIGLATILLWDLFDRSKSLAAHYTETGTIPASLLPLVTDGARFSVHYWLSDQLLAQWVLMGVAFAAGFALLVGFHTRVAGLVGWFLLSSLQVRNPLVSWEGADHLLRILLFWSLFAPVGRRFSLDARRRPRAQTDWLATPATALLVLQVCALYWITGMEKTGEAWQTGQALAHVLRFDYFGRPIAASLTQFDALLRAASYGTLGLELFGCFLLFVPWKTWAFRIALMLAFYGFHLGILATMSVGSFSLISMVAWLPLVPGQVWGLLEEPSPVEGPEEPARLRTSALYELPAAAFALFVAGSIAVEAWQFSTGRPASLPAPVAAAGRALRIQQHWPMFSPDAPRFDFWPVLQGRLANGLRVDAFRGGPVQDVQPRSVGAYFPSFKWKMHLAALAVRAPDPSRPHPLWPALIEHLCHRWNERHRGGERMRDVTVWLLVEPIVPGAGPHPAQGKQLLRHACPAARSDPKAR